MDTDGGAVRVLLVDDDVSVLKAFEAVLRRSGVSVTAANSGTEAVDRVKSSAFDVIISDISMPGMSGIELLEAVRAHDVDVPVILITGDPRLDSAIEAIEYGVSRYLAKPIAPEALAEAVLRAAKLRKLAALKKAALDLQTPEASMLGERAALEVRFASGLEQLWMAFQPIVKVSERCVFGYEALLRSDEPEMRNPANLLDAAERLERVTELGRRIRARVVEASASAPTECKFFVNLHASDLTDEELYSAAAPLSALAGRVVLEVTERASLHDVKNVPDCVRQLKGLGFEIAVDDLGSGYAGLTSFTQLDPEIAKLDMTLVRGIDRDPRRQSIVRSMRALCDDLGVQFVAEGVETAAERDTLVELGCDLLQGYLFARPARGFEAPAW